MATPRPFAQRDRDVRLVLGLRELLRTTWNSKAHFTYIEAAEALSDAKRATTPVQVEAAIKTDVRTRWALHLPQLFRPSLGGNREDPNRGAALVAAGLRDAGLGRDVPPSLVSGALRSEMELHIGQLDFVIFQRFCAVILDRLGMYVRDYGMGYRKGADVVVATLAEDVSKATSGDAM